MDQTRSSQSSYNEFLVEKDMQRIRWFEETLHAKFIVESGTEKTYEKVRYLEEKIDLFQKKHFTATSKQGEKTHGKEIEARLLKKEDKLLVYRYKLECCIFQLILAEKSVYAHHKKLCNQLQTRQGFQKLNEINLSMNANFQLLQK